MLRPEGFPRQADRQAGCVGKNGAADDLVDGRMKLEQEQLTWLQGVEVLVRRSPEVDFLQERLLSQHFKPVTVSHRNDKVDAHGAIRGVTPPV